MRELLGALLGSSLFGGLLGLSGLSSSLGDLGDALLFLGLVLGSSSFLLGLLGITIAAVLRWKPFEMLSWFMSVVLFYSIAFVPKITVIGDPLRPVDGDVDPSINMGRYVLTDAQKQRAPELIKLFTQLPAPKQFIPRCCIHKAIIEGHAEWRGLQCFSSSQQPDANNYRKPTQQYQFEEMKYPRDGMSRVHMIWTHRGAASLVGKRLLLRGYHLPGGHEA